jgi:uroporphyrinogen-III synthase
MRVLITRPAADATELSAALRTHGHEVLFDPLLTTSEEPGSAAALERSLPGVQAVVFTSPNGVRAFAAASRRRNVPVIALGDATNAAARAARFGEIESVDGDAEALTSLVVGRLNPLGGALLVVTGAEVGRDLARVLGAAGFSVRRVALYRAEPAQAFSSKVVAGFKSGTIDAAVFFSPGTATVFGRLIAASGFASACDSMTAVVTSPAVGAALKGISWDNLVVARAPTQAAILEAFGGPLPPTRPESPREDLQADEPRPERMDASPAKSGGADTAVLEPPPMVAPPATSSRLPPVRTETFAPRKKPVRPGGSRLRSVVPLLLVVAAVLGAVATSPYWAISLAAHLPWVAPGDSGVVLAKVNEMTERLDALDQRLDKRLTELAAKTTGAEDATHRIDTALEENGKHLDALDKGLSQLSAGVDSANTTAGTRATTIEEQARKLEAEFGAQSRHLDTLDKGLADLTTGGGNMVQEAQKLAAALSDQRARLDALDQRLQALATSTDTANSGAVGRLGTLEDQTRKFSTSLASQSDRLAAVGTRVETLAIATDTANASTASLRDDTQKLSAALKVQTARLDTVSASTDATAAAAAALKDDTQRLNAALKAQGDREDAAVKGQGDRFDAALKSEGARVDAALKTQADRIDAVSGAADRANADAAALKDDTQKLNAALKAQGDRLDAVSKSTDAANAAATKLADDAQKLAATVGDQGDKLVALAGQADAARAAASARSAAIEDDTRKLGGTLAEQGDRLVALDKRLDALTGASESVSGAAAALGDDTRRLADKLTDQGTRLDLVDRRLDTLGSAANSSSAAEATLGGDTAKMATALADHAGRIGLLEKRLQAASDSDLTNVTASAQVARTASLEETAEKMNAELTEQRSRLERLEATANSLETTTTDLQDRTTAIQDKTTGVLDKTTALLDRTDVALLFSVDALRATLATSKPFATELQTAESLAQQRPEALSQLRTLDERAPRGIPSLAALVYRFSLVARDVRRDEAAKHAGDNATGGVMNKLQEIVIGKAGDPSAPPDQTGIEAVLGSADAALKNEDLASAISVLKPIERSASGTVGPWIREAEARLAAESTLAALDAALARRLRDSGSTSSAKP